MHIWLSRASRKSRYIWMLFIGHGLGFICMSAPLLCFLHQYKYIRPIFCPPLLSLCVNGKPAPEMWEFIQLQLQICVTELWNNKDYPGRRWECDVWPGFGYQFKYQLAWLTRQERHKRIYLFRQRKIGNILRKAKWKVKYTANENGIKINTCIFNARTELIANEEATRIWFHRWVPGHPLTFSD